MSNRNWNNNAIQFPRLIAEIEAAGGFKPSLIGNLCESMDLSHGEVSELIERAVTEWDQIKVRT